MWKIIFALNALFFITLIWAQKFGLDPCKDVEVAPGVKNEEQMGIWYEYAKTPRPRYEGVNSTCIHFDRFEIEGKEWPFKQYWVYPGDGKKYFYEDAFDVTGEGTGKTTDGSNFTTVYSDKNVIVVYACLNKMPLYVFGKYYIRPYSIRRFDSLCHRFFISDLQKTVWILTRNEKPDKSELSGAVAKMEELDINGKKYIKKVNHENCPDDWSDATEIETHEEIAKQG